MNRIIKSKIRVSALILLSIIGGSILLFTSRSPNDPFRGQAIKNPPFTSLTYSVQGFMWWSDATLHLDWAKLMGFSHIKQTFSWNDIEHEPDVWNFTNGDLIVDEAALRDMHVIVRLGDTPDWAHPELPPLEESDYVDAPPKNLADWGNFCGKIASHFKGRIAAYQIWNEPNLSREWGNQPPDAAAYVELLKICSESIRLHDPDVILISAGLSPTGNYDDLAHRDDIYLQAMYDENFQQYIDVVGVHTPGYAVPEYGPDDAQRDGQGRWATFRRIEDLRKIMIANGDAARQMAILEVGYTTDQVHDSYRWFAVSEEDQAKNLAAAYQYAADNWRPWVGLMSSIYIAKSSWTEDDEELWWAFNNPQTGHIRPVFGAMAMMKKYCDDIIIPQKTIGGSAFATEYNPCN